MRKQIKKVLSTVLAVTLVSTSISMNDFVEDTYAATEEDVQLSSLEDGSSYLNFVKGKAVKLSLEDKEDGFTFDLYDTGGKDGEYDNSENNTVRLVAPKGYSFMVSGNVTCENERKDGLKIFNVVEEANDQGELVKVNKTLGKETYGNEEGEDLNVLVGSSNEMLFSFYSDYSKVFSGMELKITLIDMSKERGITINDITGGKLTVLSGDTVVDKSAAGKEISVKAETENGYFLSKIVVELVDGRKVEVEGGNWYSDNTGKFIMPGEEAIVTPVYEELIDALSLNIPNSGTKDVTIAKGIDSFAVYDFGGKDGEYIDYMNGTLVLRAQEGCRFEITGNVKCENGNDFLQVFDGENTEEKLGERNFGNAESDNIGILISSGNVVSLNFITDQSVVYEGVDLKIRVFETEHKYAINEKSVNGGKIEITNDGEVVTSAKACDNIVVNAFPDKGYALKELVVKRENDENVYVEGGWFTNNVVKFEMPVSDVEIIPVFAKAQNEDNFEVLIPANESAEVLVSKEIQSFKVYDFSGKDNEYGNLWEGYLKITAPEGYKFDISGSVKCENSNDYLVIFDGEYVPGVEEQEVSVLGSKTFGTDAGNGEAISNLVSSGHVITLCFHTDHSIVLSGVDLDISVFTTLSFDANGGSGEMEDVRLLGSIYTLPECEFTPVEGKTFTGWMIGGKYYKSGEDVVIGTDKVLKAIWKNIQEITFAEKKIEKTYGDENFTITANGNKSEVVYSSSDESIATVDSKTGEVTIVGAGTCAIKATAVEDDDYVEATESYELVVATKALANEMVSAIEEQKFTGSEVKPAVKVLDGDKELVVDKDYTLTYSNNVNEGTATVVVSGIGNYSGVVTLNFVIKKVKSDENVSKDNKDNNDNKDSKDSNIKVGMKVSDRKYYYKVTKKDVNGKGGEVEIIGFKKKVLSKVKVAGVIKVNGVSYKVTSVGKKAFANKKIKSVFIGKNVKVIKAKAFFGNKKLKKVTIKSKVLKKVLKKAFFAKRKKKLVVKVPSKLKKNYSKVIKKSKSGKVKIK